MAAVTIRRIDPVPDAVEALLRSLPEWFGSEDALVSYVEQARVLPAFAALDGDRMAGVALVRRHGEHAAEIALLAVERRQHRRGIGRRLLEAAEADLVAAGVEVVQVKTLGPSHPSPEYAATRRFYEAVGYVALEELHGLWPDTPCLVMVKRLPPAAPEGFAGKQRAAHPMPPSVPAGMRLELSRARLLPGAEEETERWMGMLHDRYEECVATLDAERMAFEATFRHTEADGTQWLYHVSLYGEDGSGLDLANPVDRAHQEFAYRCKEPGWEELRPVLLLAPPPVLAAMQAWGRHGAGRAPTR